MHGEWGRRNTTPPRQANGYVTSSSSPSSSSSSRAVGVSYIEHPVSKMDTLAGVAIMYGVEVADIKRMNGLVTDLQMFAHKSLHIPLPGRHPPSPILCNGHPSNRQYIPRRPENDILNSFQSLELKPHRKVSPAMSSLQGYYGLVPPNKGPIAGCTEMTVYRTNGISMVDDTIPRVFPGSLSEILPSRKSTSLIHELSECANLSEGSTQFTETERINSELSVRRRQKADMEISLGTPELLLKEDSGGGFSGRIGKGLALRPKSGSRTDMDVGGPKVSPMGDSSLVDGLFSVRKSSSTSNLQESEAGVSMWPSTKWTLKADTIARPIFDGLPKPLTVRRNKAALD